VLLLLLLLLLLINATDWAAALTVAEVLVDA